jgi:Tfp pilus assembly protein PilV
MSTARRGFSLMEVMLSTAILVGSSIALIELAAIGRKHASSAHDLNHAQLLCQAKLNEIVSGLETLEAVEEHEFLESPGWYYSIEREPISKSRLASVTVSVFQKSLESKRSKNFSLVRWLPESSVGTDRDKPNNAVSTQPSTTTTTSTGARR